MSESVDLRALKGLVATCVTTGYIDPQFASAHEEMRVWNERQGFSNVLYRRFPCSFVEWGRDEVVRYALANDCDYVLQIDADAAPFEPSALASLLHCAYVDAPDASAVGAYAQLKEPPHYPTIDRGTGTWERVLAGSGLIRAFRTGGHFLLVKTSAYRAIGEGGWHASYTLAPDFDILRDFDTLCREKMGGANPFASLPEWKALAEKLARASCPTQRGVGEDSGFCNRLAAAGLALYIDTDLVVGHVAKRVILPEDFEREMKERRRNTRQALGLYY